MRGCPCLSVDFVYAGYTDDPNEQKLCVLLVSDSSSHAVSAPPMKDNLHHGS